MSLDRFHQAQAGRWAGDTTALAEIRKGGKTSHWIWYVFPQLEGLGRSSTAQSYALRDLDEACDYLRDPVLRQRYEEITTAVAEQLANGVALETLLGGSTDALKLVSSLTLFRAAASNLAQGEAGPDYTGLTQLCDSIVQQTAALGYLPCQFTVDRCSGLIARMTIRATAVQVSSGSGRPTTHVRDSSRGRARDRRTCAEGCPAWTNLIRQS